MWTHGEDERRVRRGKDAAKGATVIFWRLAGGEEEELLALRVLLFVFVAIFQNHCGEDFLSLWPPNNIWKENGQRMVDESTEFNGNSTWHHSNTFIVVAKTDDNALGTLDNISCPFIPSRLFGTKVPKLSTIHSREKTQGLCNTHNPKHSNLFIYICVLHVLPVIHT